MNERNIVGNTSHTNPSPTAIPPSVSKQLVAVVGKGSGGNCSSTSSRKRVAPDAAEAISEAIRLFVREAHRRASIEVRGCWNEAKRNLFMSQLH